VSAARTPKQSSTTPAHTTPQLHMQWRQNVQWVQKVKSPECTHPQPSNIYRTNQCIKIRL